MAGVRAPGEGPNARWSSVSESGALPRAQLWGGGIQWETTGGSLIRWKTTALLLTGGWDNKARILLFRCVVWADHMMLIHTLAHDCSQSGPTVESVTDVSFWGHWKRPEGTKGDDFFLGREISSSWQFTPTLGTIPPFSFAAPRAAAMRTRHDDNHDTVHSQEPAAHRRLFGLCASYNLS